MSSSAGAFWTRDLGEISLRRAAKRAWRWYRQEFFALFPPSTLAFLLDRGERRLSLSADGDYCDLRAEAGADAGAADDVAFDPISSEELRAASLESALARRGLARDAAKIVLRLPRDAFFRRRTVVPLAAESDLPRLLAAELERKTPFRAADVVFGFVATPLGADKLDVEHWILRRDFIAAALAPSGLAETEIDAVEPECGAPAPSIALRPAAPVSTLLRNVSLALCGVAVLFVALSVGAIWCRQERIGEELDAKIADMSSRAARVRQAADRAAAEGKLLQVLREERARYPTLGDVWEEVSRILPDSAYAQELRLSEPRAGERALDVTGYADSAAGLPKLFDRSPIFVDAALTAPITADIREKRDTFALQAKLRPAAPEPRK
jgi:general secretion pathway protein L